MSSNLRTLVRTARILVRDLGFRRAGSLLARKLGYAIRHERPPNTREANLERWESHDWSCRGEEWTPSAEWKDAVVVELMMPNIQPGSAILEIGPGGGRWTEHLLPLALHLTLVDLTPACIAICRQRFAYAANVTYCVNDGRSLPCCEDESVDAIWSFDTFVHIEPIDIHAYMGEFRRVLRPRARAVIHHARAGYYRRSWRSNMTAERMQEFCSEMGFELLEQVSALRSGAVPIYYLRTGFDPDVVSVFRKRDNRAT